MQRGFTLLELIVVIVILGILATLGFSQYTKMVEKGRIAEVVVNFGKMRTLANAYYLQNSTFATITSADLSIGSDVPSSCDSSHYFYYQLDSTRPTDILLYANRCTSGGKVPQYGGTQYHVYMYVISDGGISKGCQEVPGSGNSTPWCAP